MAWNDTYERKKFEKEQEQLTSEYRAAGMTEEQIRQMYLFDLDFFKSRRRYSIHNQQFPEGIFESGDDSKSPLGEKFLNAISVMFECSGVQSRYWWTEEIEDSKLARAIKGFDGDQLELITLWAFEMYTQSEIAGLLGVSQAAVSKRISQIKKIINFF